MIGKEMWNKFYIPHREANNSLNNDDCIFTPAVKVFKSNISFPRLLPESEWWEVDVLTCAAPNLRNTPHNRMNPNAGNKKADIFYHELKSYTGAEFKEFLRWRLQIRQKY